MFADFYQYLKVGGRYSKHTVSAYYTDCIAFAEENHIDSIECLASISSKVLRGWFAQLMKQNFSPRSVRRKMASCRLLFEFYLKTGIISANPMDGVLPPKITSRLPTFFQETTLCEALDEATQTLKNNYQALRDLTIIELLYATGIRRSELVSLRLEDINLAQSSLKVLGKGNKERLIPLLPRMTKILEQYITLREKQSTQSEMLFLTNKFQPIYPRMVHDVVRRFFLNVEGGISARKSPHIFRHSFATHLLNNGASLNDIKTLLGHSNLSATQVYTHTAFEKLKSTHKKLHPRN